MEKNLLDVYNNCPIPKKELLLNLGLFLSKRGLARLLYMDHIYKKIIELHGIIIEFGARWGQNLALFETLRGVYEPFNANRKIIGFDTFEGFLSPSEQDGNATKGSFGVTKGYESYLIELLATQEKEGPLLSKRCVVIKGDAPIELEKYLNDHPETLVSLAYFDLDLYEPTRACLELIKDYMVKGGIIGFDELNDERWPGETIAMKEVLGSNRLIHTLYSSSRSYLVRN